ncbi:hypothetical protein [Bacillus cereus]|uniref:hypothetical protein n=1 Tax=Bacillus cereus TaxID=1396 RepID=UPI000BEE1958|nr:hypothetical protein [Bacillus cereus]PEE35912.1 hypothetical protein CON59_13885 [Bacillus cereus]PET34329.1 hypothetical protein CN523_31640 [Bacillus cereus]PEV75223.1 hypothetical protein CN429_22265 [Bacillus cereus]PFA40878.1 hypothetical protein CN389_29940 [Bacillus cereus]PFD62341.1 hypothetical protein CN271_28275 [Bacillus cereus]
MNIQEYGNREKKLVRLIGTSKLWNFNQFVLDLVEIHGIEKTKGIVSELRNHAVDIAKLHKETIAK